MIFSVLARPGPSDAMAGSCAFLRELPAIRTLLNVSSTGVFYSEQKG
jgi:hypothetical protein